MRRAIVVLSCGAAMLAGCGEEPEPPEALPPSVPADLCGLLPEEGTAGTTGSSSSSDSGDPLAVCNLAGDGRELEGLVTWLQLESDGGAQTVYETQCAGIDTSVLEEQDLAVDGADEVCAAAGGQGGEDVASLALRAGREVLTVRVTTRDDEGPPSLERATLLAEGVLPEIPRPE